jgi:hypothetical protein
VLVARVDGDSAAIADELARAKAVLARETSARAGLDARIAGAEAKVALAKFIGRHPDWSVLLDLLARERGPDIVLSRLALQPADRPFEGEPGARGASAPAAPVTGAAPGYVVRLAGQARTPAAATKFTLRLEKLGIFDSVRLVDTRPANVPGRDYVAFQIQCSIGTAPSGGAAKKKERQGP